MDGDTRARSPQDARGPTARARAARAQRRARTAQRLLLALWAAGPAGCRDACDELVERVPGGSSMVAEIGICEGSGSVRIESAQCPASDSVDVCALSPNPCASQADCEGDGRVCGPTRYSWDAPTDCACFDTCQSDADCPAGTLCVCGRSSPYQGRTTPNRCVPTGNCRTEDDCPVGQHCVAAPLSGNDLGTQDPLYYCRGGPRDDCRGDQDCDDGDTCSYDRDRSKWHCVNTPNT